MPGKQKIRTGLEDQGKERHSVDSSVSLLGGRGKATAGLLHTHKDLAVRSLFCTLKKKKKTREV